MKLLVTKGLHKIAYIGDTCNKGKSFHADYKLARDFDRYHIKHVDQSIDIDKGELYDFPIPKEVCEEIQYYTKSILDLFRNMNEVIKSIKPIENTASVRRKADYFIIKSFNDYSTRVDYYHLVDNVIGKNILFKEDEYGNWNISVGLNELKYSGLIYELTEDQYMELVKNSPITTVYRYPKLSNFIMDMIQYVAHISYSDTVDRPKCE